MPNTKKLNYTDLIVLVISFVIGMGIFKTPASVAATSGNETMFFSLWFISGLIAICGAFAFAEIGIRMPLMGAYYKIFAVAYHPVVGFVINLLILISNAASLGIVIIIGAEYAADFIWGSENSAAFTYIFSFLALGIFLGINLLGLKTTSRTQNILLLIKVSMVLLLITTLLTNVNIIPRNYDTQAQILNSGNSGWLKMFLVSLIPVSFSYGGYQQTINFGSEVKNKNVLGKSIFMGMFVVVILYMIINIAYVHVIGFNEMKNAKAIGALLCEVWFGKWGGKVFDLIMILSVLAYVNVLLMSNPRVMSAMSIDKLLPKFLSYTNPKTGALTYGLIIYAILAFIIIFIGKKVDDILGFTMFLDSAGMITAVGTLFILRKKILIPKKECPSYFKYTKGMAILFMLFYGAVAYGVILKDKKAALIAIGLMLVCVLIFYAIKMMKQKNNFKNIEKN